MRRAKGRNIGSGRLACVPVMMALAGVASCERGPTQASSTSSALGAIPFPGSGTGGQNDLLLAGFTPNACLVAGPTASFDGSAFQNSGADQVTCYYASASATTPMAFLEQLAGENHTGSKGV